MFVRTIARRILCVSEVSTSTSCKTWVAGFAVVALLSPTPAAPIACECTSALPAHSYSHLDSDADGLHTSVAMSTLI